MGLLRIRFLGLTITSSWGNGHATTYRGLMRELVARGHDVLFLEHDKSWYASNRDLPHPPYGRTELYQSVTELKERFAADIRDAEVVIVGSYVPEGVAVGEWVTSHARGLTAFYDIDTPVTLAKLARGDDEYHSAELIPCYDLYLSFTGGKILRELETVHGARRARPLYCSVDPTLYYPEAVPMQWDLGYLGTYSDDRQPALDRLLLEPARRWPEGRFTAVGPLYPADLTWPSNVARADHLPPAEHRGFYNAQHFTLNITRADMVHAGHSPSVRLFEAAACGTPIISDSWPGLEEFFTPGEEILVADTTEQALHYLQRLPERDRRALGEGARRRVLARHTAAHRAEELEAHLTEAMAAIKAKGRWFNRVPWDCGPGAARRTRAGAV